VEKGGGEKNQTPLFSSHKEGKKKGEKKRSKQRKESDLILSHVREGRGRGKGKDSCFYLT